MSTVATPERSDPGRKVTVERHRWVTIRPIEASDADGLFAFYAALSPDARQSRFLGAGRIDEQAAQRFADVDHLTRDGLVAVLREAGLNDGAIVGHACLEPDSSGVEEIAFAVADGLRGLGIGTALMAGAVGSARRRRVRRLTATMFATNVPMRRLALQAGSPVHMQPAGRGVTQVDLDVAA